MQKQTIEAIIGQLKSYGYYSIAKTIGDQSEISSAAIQPSNQLEKIVSTQQTTANPGSKQLEKSVENTGLNFDAEKKLKINPNFRNSFNTQHRSPVRAAAFSLDGSLIATGSEDTTVKVLDAQVIREGSFCLV